MSALLRHANLVVTVWDGELLVGIARTMTDCTYVGYLADLAVRLSHQKRGIGIDVDGANSAEDGAALDTGAARRAKGRRVLSQNRLYPTRQPLNFARCRALCRDSLIQKRPVSGRAFRLAANCARIVKISNATIATRPASKSLGEALRTEIMENK